ncbi:hypothetical protein KPH14_001331 [Odynerus spinipes]|uniref:CCHC-type domain-containing protein n=1 Tax=Odynerus spinipes TaxID=1348599 RepID=A0AAD9RF77_9HYME|nr:hypothetical protein KPH14_001331 [Odynerus spinipes]
MGRGKSLSEKEKDAILAYTKEDLSIREISRRLGRSHKVILNFINNPDTYGRNKKGGPKKKLTPRTERTIIKAASNTQKSCNQIVKECNLDVSRWTVYRVLKNNPYITRQKLKSAPKLLTRHKIARLEYVRENMNRDWNRVTFIVFNFNSKYDESTFYVCGTVDDIVNGKYPVSRTQARRMFELLILEVRYENVVDGNGSLGLRRLWKRNHFRSKQKLKGVSMHMFECQNTLPCASDGQVLNLSQKLIGIGNPVDDKLLAVIMIAGLPPEYKPLVMGIDGSGKEITSDLIKNKLLQEEIKTQKETESSDVAFTSKSEQRHPTKKFYRKELRCYGCNKRGHVMSQCCRDVVFFENEFGSGHEETVREDAAQFDPDEPIHYIAKEDVVTQNDNVNSEETINEEKVPGTSSEASSEERRYPLRERKSRYFPDQIRHEAFVASSGEPTTVDEALSSDEKLEWKSAMDKEFKSLKENQVWDLTTLRQGIPPSDCYCR